MRDNKVMIAKGFGILLMVAIYIAIPDPFLINIYLYLLLMCHYIKKERNNYILIYITAIYLFVAIVSLLINDTQFYTWGKYYKYGNMLRQPASLLSLLYVFIGYLIFVSPIKSWNNEDIQCIYPINMNKAYLFCFFSIGISLICIVNGMKNAMQITDYAEAYKLIKESGSGEKTIFQQIGIICSGLRSASMILAFYFLTDRIRKYTLGTILLIVTVLARYTDATLAASRGAIFFLLFELIISFLIFKNFIAKEVKKRIALIICIFLLFFIILVISISLSRFDTQMINSIASYFGESYINFSRIFWNYPAPILKGQYTFGNIFDIDIVTNLPIGYFKTFAGGAYIDFGMVGGLVFLAIQAFTWKLCLGKVSSKVSLQQLMIYHFIVMMILSGAFSFAYNGWSCYAILFLSYILFKYIQLKHK